jgi:hypothetical protein
MPRAISNIIHSKLRRATSTSVAISKLGASSSASLPLVEGVSGGEAVPPVALRISSSNSAFSFIAIALILPIEATIDKL